jgi:hypothetical protein
MNFQHRQQLARAEAEKAELQEFPDDPETKFSFAKLRDQVPVHPKTHL